ncbi:MAG: nitrous oxide reductase family maturation protein NosD [Gemmatimonadales bacterium]|jgi:nitrous oxidase accessory protein
MRPKTAGPASRLIVLAAALALVLLYFVPLWQINLDAPQFPEGIGLLIRINTIDGVHPHDLQNINGLNHYIGMKEIHPDSIRELSWMPWILAGLIGWGLLAAAVGRRWMICTWFGLLALAAVAGLADFYAWGYDYGHNLDAERAIIKVPGMTYQPPLIGSKKLLNFTAVSLPALGGWIAIAAGLLAGWRCWLERRLAKRGAAGGRAGGALVLLLAATLSAGAAGCGDLPERTVDHAAMDHERPASPGAGEDAAGFESPPDAGSDDRPLWLVVEPGGALASIGEAVRRAAPGARILVRPGLYREPTVVVDRPLTIEGEGWPVVDGEGQRQLFTVTADDVRITGLDLRNVGVSYLEDRAAVRVENAERCEIDHNRIHGGFFAIYLARTTDCRVIENDITGTGTSETDSGNGIHGWYSKRVVVTSNRVSGHRDGIYFEFVEDGRIAHNQIVGNLRYGLHFMFSDGGRYEANIFADNVAGVAVMYTSDIAMAGNRFEHNQGSSSYGLLLKDITDSRITGNVFRANSVGLYAEGFDRTTVDGNLFRENGRAIRLLSNSTRSSFRQNDFVANTFDVTTNGRHVRSSFRGNHWDRYRGYDLDGDGTGDVPFRPVRLFALVVERAPVTTILLRSFFVSFLDWTEALIPALTPENLVDPAPAMASVADPRSPGAVR